MAQRELLRLNGEKFPLYLNRTDFMKILSEAQDQCSSHNNLKKSNTTWSLKFLSFGFRLNRLDF